MPPTALLDPATLPADPMVLLGDWRDRVRASGTAQPDAMVLATAAADAVPSARTVLSDVIDGRGVTFHSSHPSRKTLDLAANARAGAVFGWYAAARQVVLNGPVEPLRGADNDAAFARRDPGLRLLAWAYQHGVDPAELPAALAREARRWGDRVPERPPGWRGYRLLPLVAEFWAAWDEAEGAAPGDAARERVRYTRAGQGWTITRVLP